jgi:hypothetical protein
MGFRVGLNDVKKKFFTLPGLDLSTSADQP